MADNPKQPQVAIAEALHLLHRDVESATLRVRDTRRRGLMTNIAILGWGSLLWDENKAQREFDEHHGPWKFDGPVLKLEFCRKSESRINALTLVIDAIRGEECKVAYALSKRRTVENAIADLQQREGTGPSSTGAFSLMALAVRAGTLIQLM